MIPPLQASRLRAVRRWLIDGGQFDGVSDAIDLAAAKLDSQMIGAFDALSGELQTSMMRMPSWGTEDAIAEYRMAEMELWRGVMETFLPFRE